MYKICLVEDEKDLNNLLKTYIEKAGYEVVSFYNGIDAYNFIGQEKVDLWILDIMLGDSISGYDLIKKIREYNQNVPVIFTSARDQDLDKIIGLELGSDDYITKPFVPLELLARVKSHLRRHKKYLNALNQTIRNSYTVGGLEIDLDTKEVSVDGRIVKVTPIEFKILELLMKSPGRVYSASQIYEIVWQEEAIATDTVMVHIRNLREKI